MHTKDNDSSELETFEEKYVQGMAKSLGSNSMDEIARRLGYSDARALADDYGFKSIFAFFATQGNAERFAEIEMTLDSLTRGQTRRAL